LRFQHSAEPVQTRRVQSIVGREALERFFVGDIVGAVLGEQLLHPVGGKRLGVDLVQPEVLLAVDVDDVADRHQRDLLDRSLAAELGEGQSRP